MPATTIRFATPDDAATLHGFISALAMFEREPDAVEVDIGTLRRQLASQTPPFECLFAETDDGPVGCALFFHNYSTWRGRHGIYLEDLYVLESARGRGIGKALLTRLAELAVERDCARLDWAVLDWNQTAIDFYETLGARRVSGWSGFRLTGEALAALAQKHCT